MIRPSALSLSVLFALAGCDGKSGAMDDTGMHHGLDDTGVDYATEQMTDGGTWMVSYTTVPSPLPYNAYFDLTLSIADATGQTVAVDARMPEHNHGMNVTPEVTDHGDGTWTASPMLFHMQGTWEITVDVGANEPMERATFNVLCCED